MKPPPCLHPGDVAEMGVGLGVPKNRAVSGR
jgi:hypothetical protein